MTAYYVKPDGSANDGTVNGQSWVNAFHLVGFIGLMNGTGTIAITDGDTVFILGGSYANPGSALVGIDGTSSSAPIKIIGVKSTTSAEPPTYADWASLQSDYPYIDMGTYEFEIGNYTEIRHLNIYSTSQYTIDADNIGTQIVRCKVTNAYATTYGRAIVGGTNSAIYLCELACAGSATKYGIINYRNNSRVFGNYVRGFKFPFYFQSSGHSVNFNIADCDGVADSVAMYIAGSGLSCGNNVFYDATTAIYCSTSCNSFLNNIINECSVGVNNYSDELLQLWVNNNFYNAVNPQPTMINRAADPTDTSVNPNFTNAVNGDFSLSPGSSCINAGQSIELGVG